MKIPSVPHPIPYQGSKRRLAPRILELVAGRQFQRLFEPFAGSGALTLAAATAGLARRFHIGDSLAPLARVWGEILERPGELADAYALIWGGQHRQGSADHYRSVRERYNGSPEPAALLYLLARCVKNSPRWNAAGAFNQSADHRRSGMRPERMRLQIDEAHALLRGRAEARCEDFRVGVASAGAEDLVYLDPPFQGTSLGADRRYHAGLEREALIETLAELCRRRVPFLLSYDGACGGRTYGDPLPPSLGLQQIPLDAGRSSQSTLLGRSERTVESLYVGPNLQTGRSPRRARPSSLCSPS